MTLATQKAKV